MTARALAVPAPRRTGAPPARRRHLRIAPDPGAARRWRILLVAGIAVSIASTFLLVAFNVLVAQGQLELERLSAQLDAEQRTYEQTRLQVAELASPTAIVQAAEELGMVRPERLTYVEAPEAAPRGDAVDATSSTLQESFATVRSSLADSS